MKFLSLIFLFLFYSSIGRTQATLTVTAHYPESAYVVERLLPFSVVGVENISITSVEVEGVNSCVAFEDPFHTEVFHIYCREPGTYSFIIRARAQGVNQILVINNLLISEQRAPGEEMEPEGGATTGGTTGGATQ